MESWQINIKDSIFIGAAFGILSGILFYIEVSFLATWLFLMGLIVCGSFLVFNKNQRIFIIFLFCIFGFIGSVRMSVEPPLQELPLGKLTVEGVVSEYPEVRDSGIRYGLDVTKIDSNELKNPIHILVDAVRFPEAKYGEHIIAHGTVRELGTIVGDDGRSFDYKSYVRARGYSGVLSFASISSIQSGNSGIKSFLFSIRDWLSDGIDRALPEPSSGLLKGILLGEKHAMGKDAEESFRGAGLSHIVVLSGYNVMIIISSILFFVRRISLRFAPYLAGLGLVSFVVATGGEETAIRAGFMASIMLLGLILRRKYIAGRALGIATILFALISPFSATSTSFMLSVTATFAVVYAAPKFFERFTRIPERMSLREVISTTVAAQILVAPVILFSIGKIPILSIFANVLVLPIMPLTMLFGFVSAISGAVNFLPLVFGFPTYFLLEYVLKVAHSFAEIPFALHVPAFSGFISWALYVAVIPYFMREIVSEKN